jgi:hypothetical protein
LIRKLPFDNTLSLSKATGIQHALTMQVGRQNDSAPVESNLAISSEITNIFTF